MTIPVPSVTFKVTPPGGAPVNLTQYLTWSGHQQQMTITQNFGRQGDTAQLPLVDEFLTGSPHFAIRPESRVSLVDNNLGITLFAGVVSDPVQSITGPTRSEWTLNAVDHTFYADNSTPVTATFVGQSIDQMVIAITELANCGITAASIADGGFVAPGPVLPSVALTYASLSDQWKTLAQLAGQVTPYGWFVDEDLQLHFYDATTALDSGVTFTTHPTVAGSATEGHIALDSQNQYEWDGTSVHNRILVQGATQTIFSPQTGPQTDTRLGDGVTAAWPLRFTVSSVGQLLVGGARTTVTMVQAGGVPSGVWNVIQNTNGQWFLTTTAPPGRGVVIKIWYDYQVPIVAQASDPASQALYTGPNGGIFGEYINDTSLITQGMALARAQRERTEYAFAAERATFSTTEEWIGWVRAGNVFGYINQFVPDSQTNYSFGLNDTFLAIQNTVTWTQGFYRTMLLKGVRV